MTAKLAMGRTEWTLLIILSVLWGGSFFFAKIALAEIPPLTLVLLRVSIAASALYLFLRITGRVLPKSASLWGMFAMMGLLNNLIPFCLLFWGQTHIGAGLASIFNALAPVFTVIVAHVFLTDEKLTFGKGIGVICGLLGVAVLIGLDMSKGLGLWTILAMTGCLIAALAYGFASVYGRRFGERRIDPFTVAFGQLACTTVMMIPVAFLTEAPLGIGVPSTGSIAAVLMLALASTALGYVIFFRILARGGATNISLVAFLIPVSAILLSALFLGERLSANHVAGMGMIFLGLSALDGRLWHSISKSLSKWNSAYDLPRHLKHIDRASNARTD